MSLFVILLAGLVSAVSFSTSTNSIALTPGINSTTFTISSANSTTLSLVPSLNYPDGTAMPVTPSPSSLTVNGTSTITLTSAIDYTNLKLGKTYTGSILISNQENLADNSTIALNVQKTYCDLGDKGSALRITRIRDEKITNDNAFEWHLLDNVEITVRIENVLDEDIDAIVEYKLIDSDGNEVDLNQDSIDVSINSDDSEEITITFQVPTDDSTLSFTTSSKDFRFYVKAYEDGNEAAQCTDNLYASSSQYETATIKKESRDVIVTNLQLQDSASCGDSLTLTGTLANVGYKDETRVKITLANTELEINLAQEFKTMDSSDSKSFSFQFTLPKNATEKNYDLQLRTFFNYDKNSVVYDDSSSYFTKVLTVSGNCVKPIVNNALWAIASEQLADATAGKEVTITANLKNTGEQSATYITSLTGYEGFASVTSIDPTTTVLAPGMAQDITIVLKLNSDAEGAKTFNIKALYAGQEKSQAVSFTITPRTGFSLPSSLTNNWIIWVIILVNVILIVAIIIVAVRMARN